MSDIWLTHTHISMDANRHTCMHIQHRHTHHTGEEGSWLGNMLPAEDTKFWHRTQRFPKPSATLSSGEPEQPQGLVPAGQKT